jgi:hypothetical protein
VKKPIATASQRVLLVTIPVAWPSDSPSCKMPLCGCDRYTSFVFDSGNSRTRLPVAANTAL